jgi:hypothetical protein
VRPFDQGGGFIVAQVKVRHGPDMVPVRSLINRIYRHRALVRGSTARRSKALGREKENAYEA